MPASDLKITALTAIGANPVNPATFPMPMVDLLDNSMAASGTTKKVTVNQILGAGGTATLASATITGALTVDTTTLVANAAGYTDLVGVGTATPAYKLHAVVTSGAVAKFGASTAAIARLLVGNTVGDLEVKVNANADGQITSDAGKYLGLGSNTSNDRVILTTTGNLSITNGNVVMATSGTGIDFGATTPDGTGTVTSELLNDYEEGTWVGTLKGSVSNPTIAVTATGTYTKVGRKVTVNINYNNVSTVGASGNVTIDGLPFNGPQNFAGSSIAFDLFATSTTLASWNAGTEIEFFILGAYSKAQHNPGTGKYLTTTITYNV